MRQDWKPDVAEAIGVFFLVLAGGGAILGGAADLTVALVFGFVVAALIYAFGHVSGAHFNPAITLAFALTRHFQWPRVPRYIAAQVVGAAGAAAVLRLVFDDVGAVTTHVADGLGLPAAIAVEVLASTLLALVIIGVATDARAAPGAAGLAIGLAVAVNAAWAGPLTGASTNPARSLGPALVAADAQGLWLYLSAPFLGAALGMTVYELLRSGRKPKAAATLGSLGPVDLDAKEA